MRILYISPMPNLILSNPSGEAIRIRELIRGFEKNSDEVFTICAGDKFFAHQSTQIYRKGIKKRLPVKISGLMHDYYHIAHDRVFRHKAQREASKLLPLDFIIEQYTFFCETGVSVARNLNTPLILDDIAPLWEQEVYFQRDLQKVARKIQRKVFEEASTFIAVSNEIREYLLSCNVPKEKIHLVANGADCDKFKPRIGGNKIRESYNIQNKIVIGFVGSFAPWHGLDMLISCAKDLLQQSKDIHFLIVGDGAKRDTLKQRVDEWKIGDNITFTGAIPYEQIPPFIDAMDITVLPNTATYCSPIKIFEYMSMEKAVVAPRYNPIMEIITEGKDGLLFSPGDLNEMNQIILNLVVSESKRINIGKNARQRIVNHFTWVKQAAKIRNIFLPTII